MASLSSSWKRAEIGFFKFKLQNGAEIGFFEFKLQNRAEIGFFKFKLEKKSRDLTAMKLLGRTVRVGVVAMVDHLGPPRGENAADKVTVLGPFQLEDIYHIILAEN